MGKYHMELCPTFCLPRLTFRRGGGISTGFSLPHMRDLYTPAVPYTATLHCHDLPFILGKEEHDATWPASGRRSFRDHTRGVAYHRLYPLGRPLPTTCGACLPVETVVHCLLTRCAAPSPLFCQILAVKVQEPLGSPPTTSPYGLRGRRLYYHVPNIISPAISATRASGAQNIPPACLFTSGLGGIPSQRRWGTGGGSAHRIKQPATRAPLLPWHTARPAAGLLHSPSTRFLVVRRMLFFWNRPQHAATSTVLAAAPSLPRHCHAHLHTALPPSTCQPARWVLRG